MADKVRTLAVFAPGREFVLPYLEAALPVWHILRLEKEHLAGGCPGDADVAIMLSGTEIYMIPDCGCDKMDESGPIDSSSALAEAERAFGDYCRRVSLNPIVLRCANTVGTGMKGLPMELVRWIHRGWLMHFPGNDTRLSAVHAVDIAECVHQLVEKGLCTGALTLNATDCADPSVHDLCEAFAFRLGSKRIYTLSTKPQQFIARWFYGKRLMHILTTTVTFDGLALRKLVDVKPVHVAEYLTTHVYDESSL